MCSDLLNYLHVFYTIFFTNKYLHAYLFSALHDWMTSTHAYWLIKASCHLLLLLLVITIPKSLFFFYFSNYSAYFILKSFSFLEYSSVILRFFKIMINFNTQFMNIAVNYKVVDLSVLLSSRREFVLICLTAS